MTWQLYPHLEKTFAAPQRLDRLLFLQYRQVREGDRASRCCQQRLPPENREKKQRGGGAQTGHLYM